MHLRHDGVRPKGSSSSSRHKTDISVMIDHVGHHLTRKYCNSNVDILMVMTRKNFAGCTSGLATADGVGCTWPG